MKKIITILIALMLSISVVGCNSSSKDSSDTTKKPTEQTSTQDSSSEDKDTT